MWKDCLITDMDNNVLFGYNTDSSGKGSANLLYEDGLSYFPSDYTIRKFDKYNISKTTYSIKSIGNSSMIPIGSGGRGKLGLSRDL